MTKSDGDTAAQSLRNRTSRRFDRSPSNRRGRRAGDSDGDVTTPVEGEPVPNTADGQSLNEAARDMAAGGAMAVVGGSPEADLTVTRDTSAGEVGTAQHVAETAPSSSESGDAHACGRCGHDLSLVNIEVDGTVLVMESCDYCDARRWHLAGEPIELQDVLDHVGEHAGRRR